MPHEEGTFPAADGVELYWQTWRPDGDAKATVALLHGIFEHGGRYADFAAALNARGYAVYALDHRGHGHSGGRRASIRRFDQYIDDAAAFLERVRATQTGKPLFLFGHSMGAQVAGLLAIERQPDLRGLILSAPAVHLGEGVFPLLRIFAGLLSVLAPNWRLVRMGCRYISRDPAVVERFKHDPLVFHDRFPIRTGAEALRAAAKLRRKLEGIRLPLLVIHGTGDVVAASSGSEELYARAASADKTLKLYEGLYHECLSEPEKDRVMADILAWLDARAVAPRKQCGREQASPPCKQSG